MAVIGDLVTRERRGDAVAIRTASRAGSYSYGTCCEKAWKAGNLLRHYGVRGDATVAIDPGETLGDERLTPPPIVAFLGAVLLGATTEFRSTGPLDGNVRALVAPTDHAGEFDPQPGTTVLGYGAVPEDPEIAHFEREAWSENPTTPPDRVDSDAVALAANGECYTHGRLMEGAEEFVDRHGLDADTEVTIRAPLSDPGTVVAGVLAPLSAGGTILLDAERTGTVAVARDASDPPEPSVADPVDVL